MPSASKAQQRAMAAAEHGADFPLARTLRESMTTKQLHDFASGSMQGKPEHTRRRIPTHEWQPAGFRRKRARADG